MSGTTTSKLSLSNAVECTYVFKVTVKDDKGATASAEVRLAVKQPLTTSARTSTVEDDNENATASSENLSGSPEAEFRFSLGQNYPNPFAGRTSIPFTLSKAQHVVLKVFNDKGSEVATILDDDLAAGEHVAELTSEKLNSSADLPGVYYYKLLSKERTITHRMILNR